MTLPFNITAEKTVTMSTALIDAITAVQGQPPVADSLPKDDVFPFAAAAVVAAQRAQEQKAKQEEVDLKNKIGTMIPGKGILVGPVTLGDKNYTVYAAPQDLTDAPVNYDDAKRLVEELPENWNGYKGTHYENDEAIYAALADGSYVEEGKGWVIPPREVQAGTDANDRKTQTNTLVAVQNKVRGAFNTSAEYFSSTVRDDGFVAATKFPTSPASPDGTTRWAPPAFLKARVRPVRFERA